MKETSLWQKLISPLIPHSADPRMEHLENTGLYAPTILISPEAYMDTLCIIENAGDEEIGWLGTVEEIGSDSYLIGKVFLFSQTVTAVSCEFDEADLGKFRFEKIKEDPANRALMNSVLFWGHLHPGSGEHATDPSGQDERQMEIFSSAKYFIRGICSRHGKFSFTFFDYEQKVKFTDCPWRIHFPASSRNAEIAEEIRTKVRRPMPMPRFQFFGEKPNGKQY